MALNTVKCQPRENLPQHSGPHASGSQQLGEWKPVSLPCSVLFPTNASTVAAPAASNLTAYNFRHFPKSSPGGDVRLGPSHTLRILLQQKGVGGLACMDLHLCHVELFQSLQVTTVISSKCSIVLKPKDLLVSTSAHG